MKPIKIILEILLFIILSFYQINGQRSIAYVWNNQMLESIKKDFARPPVHARNLYHLSLVFYEVWTIFEKKSNHYILNDTSSFLDCRIKNFRYIGSKDSAIHKAISYGAYRIINQRFKNSPGYQTILADIDKLMKSFNYNILDNSLDYSNGNAAALGNAIANCIIQYGLKDGSNEENNYASKIYLPINDSMIPTLPGNPNLKHPNRWQPLWLSRNIDQNGNPIAALQKFQSPEWGNVIPFSLANPKNNFREGQIYPIYIDPGSFPLLDTSKITKESEEFKWNMELVLAWSSHLDPNDTAIIDISPNGLGNVQRLPNDVSELSQFYDFKRGGDGSTGYPSNPYTNLPYKKQMVKRGDYTRAIAQYWADGPETETPPGHWYSIFNKYVTDRIGTKKFAGKDIQISELEWDVKAYLCLGSALHDAAIAAWGIKGWYDGVRPISAIRYMAMKGQSSDPQKPSYHPAGLHLIDGLIELVTDNDPLRGDSLQNINKIKVKVWKGIPNIGDPLTSNAGVGWILAENWWPFQEKTFVSPPFAGYISGHSTFSRAAADILTYITGSNFFPEGYAEFKIYKDNVFLRTEAGPSQDLNLQWATFQDAANQSSLSRIWGGIHPPMDDIPGRKIGIEIAKKVFSKAKKLFYFDLDQDGFVSIDDCDDTNPKIFPGAKEYCDLIDSNCNGVIDDSIQNISYFADFDLDGFGSINIKLDTCIELDSPFWILKSGDCDDLDSTINPLALEKCDKLDNNCDGFINNNLNFYSLFRDLDNDGFGNDTMKIDTCISLLGYSFNGQDCNDQDSLINPNSKEIQDGIDNNCDGIIDNIVSLKELFTENFVIFPNPSSDGIFNFKIKQKDLIINQIKITDLQGKIIMNEENIDLRSSSIKLNPNKFKGLFFCELVLNNKEKYFIKLIVL